MQYKKAKELKLRNNIDKQDVSDKISTYSFSCDSFLDIREQIPVLCWIS